MHDSIRRMGVYLLAAKPPSYYSALRWKVLLVFLAFAGAAAGLFKIIPAWRGWFPQLPGVPITAFLLCLFGAMFSAYFFLRHRKTIGDMREYSLTITRAGVVVHRPPLQELFLSRDEIIGLEERKKGLVLRTADRSRVIPIRHELERFEECRSELIGMGIPAIQPRRLRDMALIFGPLTAALAGAALFLSPNHTAATVGICLIVVSLLWLAINARGWIATYGGNLIERWASLAVWACLLVGGYLSAAWHARRVAEYVELVGAVLLTLLLLSRFYRWIMSRRQAAKNG